MSTITCLKELEEREKLDYEDIVKFTIKEKLLKYKVRGLFLQNLSKGNLNDEIFKILKIDKWEIAEKTYKYEPINKKTRKDSTQWPETKSRDFSTLTRLVKELYLIIEEQKPVYTKFTRFEIMEI